MANLENLLESCIKKGENVISKMRETSFAPDSRKAMKVFSLKEAADLIGVTREAIRKAENEERLPRMGISSKTKKREFTLVDINKCRDYFGTRPSKGKDGETCVVAFINFKGGVYKSTTSIHYAHHMALKGFKVLFIDADSQATSTQFFGYIPDGEKLLTIGECLNGTIEDLSELIVGTSWDGLDLIPANLTLYDSEISVPINVANKKINKNFYLNLRKGIDTVKDNYDLIVIDAPPSLGIVNMNIVYAADALIIPVPPLFADFASTLQFFTMLREVVQLIPEEREYKFIKLLITKFDGSDEAKAFVRIIRHVFGQNLVINNIFSNTAEIPRASQDLKTIYEITDIKVKKTFDRALNIVKNVNNEIENLVKATWPAYSEDLMVEGVF